MTLRLAIRSSRDSPTRTAPSANALVLLCGIGACAWIAAVMLAFPRAPVDAAGAVLAPLLVVVLFAVPWARLVTVVAGGLLVLGADDAVGTAKIAFAVLIALCAALSTVSLLRDRSPWLRPFRLLLIPGLVLGMVIVGGAAFSPVPWSTPAVLRGSVFWLLIIVAPIIGLDAARTLSPKAALRFAGIVGLVAAVGLATHWFELRGVSTLDIGHWLLPSIVVPAVGFTVGFVQTAVCRGRARFAWAALTAATFVFMVLSGSRTNLLVLAAALGTLGAQRLWRVPVRRALTSTGLIVSVILLTAPAFVVLLIMNPVFYSSRLDAVVKVFNGGLGNDASFLMRADQQSTAMGIIGAHPWFGYGAGWVLDQVMDTPWVTVVRIGFVGVAALLAFLVCCGIAIVRSARGGRSSVGHTVASGCAVFFVCLLVLASPVDDHGFGFALMLIFVLVGTHLRASAEQVSASGRRRPRSAPRHRFEKFAQDGQTTTAALTA